MSTYIVRLILNLSFSCKPLSRGQVVYFIGFTHQFMMASAIVGPKLKGFSSPLRLCDSSGGLFRLEHSDVKKFSLDIRLLVSKIATYLNLAMSACPGDYLTTLKSMRRITLFTWGYWGWGNSVNKFIEATDAVEAARGYSPPIFADIRIRRSVRAKGFNGNAFEKIVGAERHVWMKDLGNQAVADGNGGIEIANPKASAELLDLAINAAKDRRRVIFFCACEKSAGCHRFEVASLVLREAKKRGLDVEIVEWPGGEPIESKIEAPKSALAALLRGLKYIPMGNGVDLARLGGLPWGSTIKLHNGNQSEYFLTGPAYFQVSNWCLPVLNLDDDVDEWREENGYAARRSV